MTGFWFAWFPWAGIVVVHVLLRTYRALAFGLFAFFLLLLPVMFTTAHTLSFHLYVPEIGVMFLLASAANALCRLSGERRRRATEMVLTAVAVVIMVGSVFAVRTNVRALIAPNVPLPRIFVLRRSVQPSGWATTFPALRSFRQACLPVYPGPRASRPTGKTQRALSATGARSACWKIVSTST